MPISSEEGIQVPAREEPPPAWATFSAGEVSARLAVPTASGLSDQEAAQRLQHYGYNRLREEEHESLGAVFLEEAREPLILLLIGVGVLYGLLGEITDALVIFAVIVFVVAAEVFNERRAEQALAALRRLAEPTAAVVRNGTRVEVPVEAIVPGDVLVLEAGRRVAADARLVESHSLAVDESPLTGEAVPAEKAADAVVPGAAPPAEQPTMVFAGTTVTRGKGQALVVRTGPATELGQIATLATEQEAPRTPLQRSMRELSRGMVWLALGLSGLVPLLGWLLAGQPLDQMILTGLSLAFATIPEELPILITVVLALGAYRLARQQAIVKQLRAVETLGSITVIASDKTGTLTENQMQVARLVPEEQRRDLLRIGVLCNEAVMNGTGAYAGDPLEVALLRAAEEAGLDVAALRRAYPVRAEFSFDNVRKRMAVVYEHEGRLWSAVKGAPEAVLDGSTAQRTSPGVQPLVAGDRAAILQTVADLSAQGLRVLALAEKPLAGASPQQQAAETGLVFVGLAAFADPPRPEAHPAIALARTAGVRTIMVTGDHPRTALVIARQVGLAAPATLEEVITGPQLDTLSADELRATVGRAVIYARTTPEHKLRLVRALQGRGERVAATGDGINDGPALAAADIGVAMGETGTDVARAAADLVLADDNFATIVQAIREGRLLFANLRKSVRYYLACKVALVAATLLPALLGLPVPLSPIQIILTELFMDLAASAAFVAERPEADLMAQPPRDAQAPFLDRAMVSSIGIAAAGLFAAVAGAYLIAVWGGAGRAEAQTLAFVTWLLGHVLLALNLRSEREPVLRLGLWSNRVMLIWAGATGGAALLVTLGPAVRAVLGTTPLSGPEWMLAGGLALAGTCWLEIGKWVRFGRDRRRARQAGDTPA